MQSRPARCRSHWTTAKSARAPSATCRTCPGQSLKIDESFVDPIVNSASGTALSEVVIKVAQATVLRAVAEGVETLEQAAALRHLGCHRG
ncbi:EAL domain-containing protein [Actinoplanes sp. Pm04-4]|uniref:EAL domain-containing protein n=1 Tax=Paractinoplanes pyxinae TaxID=2997416 RepID=A0ABT4BIM9_9ACTN|nr:EAL domain-containing protein [Actinoplanes pyxinae]MCY1145690.1 EAL domain-containing protein [Actinoplanes pyxinae]